MNYAKIIACGYDNDSIEQFNWNLVLPNEYYASTLLIPTKNVDAITKEELNDAALLAYAGFEDQPHKSRLINTYPHMVYRSNGSESMFDTHRPLTELEFIPGNYTGWEVYPLCASKQMKFAWAVATIVNSDGRLIVSIAGFVNAR